MKIKIVCIHDNGDTGMRSNCSNIGYTTRHISDDSIAQAEEEE